jgi:hypothetical protein
MKRQDAKNRQECVPADAPVPRGRKKPSDAKATDAAGTTPLARLGVFAFSSTNPRRRRTTIIAHTAETEWCQQITPKEPK